MPRKPRPECSESYFHIYNRCINKEWFIEDQDHVWNVFVTHLNFCTCAYGMQIYSFVLMGNHFHILARFPEKNRARCMHHFSKQVSHDLRKPSHRINSTWGARYGCSQIHESEIGLKSIYKYIYCNPVEAGLAKSVEEYRYSTLHRKLGFAPLDLVTFPDPIWKPENCEETLRWLNQSPEPAVWEALVRNSKKAVFKNPTDRKTRWPLAI